MCNSTKQGFLHCGGGPGGWGVSAQTQGRRLTAALHPVAPKVTPDIDLELTGE